jgi:hypothetical protein
MKHTIILLTTLIVILSLTSCDKDYCKPTGFQGEWEWIESTGGFGGWTITPETLMTTKTLKIDEFIFSEYQNDSLIFESQYDLFTRPDSAWGTNKYIRYENGGEEAVLLNGSDLQLIELCHDCFSHLYKRK